MTTYNLYVSGFYLYSITRQWAVTWYHFKSPFALISDPNPNPNPYPESYHNPNPIPSPNQTYWEMKLFFPRSGENWSRDHLKAASKNEKYVGICLQISKILKSEKILGEWISACVHKWWVQHEQLPKVVFDKLYSPFLIGNLSRSLIGIIILFIVYAR